MSDVAIPAFLDVRLTRTPDQLARDAAGVRQQIEDFKRRRTHMTMGPKAAQIRALRERRAQESERKTTTINQPKQETTVTTKKPSKPTKAKKPTKTEKPAPAKKAAAGKGVRAGSKLEIVVRLLQRAGGCTTKDVLKATGWPAVSMPQQAKAAGLTLKKEKVDGVTRYSA